MAAEALDSGKAEAFLDRFHAHFEAHFGHD
jgi:hypothetical protein